MQGPRAYYSRCAADPRNHRAFLGRHSAVKAAIRSHRLSSWSGLYVKAVDINAESSVSKEAIGETQQHGQHGQHENRSSQALQQASKQEVNQLAASEAPHAEASLSQKGQQEQPHASSHARRTFSAPMRSYFIWPKLRRLQDRPPFLADFAVPEGECPNINSFLGSKETHDGKLYVPANRYPDFLNGYLEAYNMGYLLFLSEKYHHQPFRYFAELDFDWTLDLAAVEAVTHQVISIVVSTVQSFYQCTEPPAYLISMRTPYKVHLNFPTVITTEPLAHMCRDKVVASCKEALGTLPGLDWERIVDFPHGSFRLLGSRKTRYMDQDPDWVVDKAYYPVSWREDLGQWRPSGIHFRLLQQMSIFPDPRQLREFESSALFRDMAYKDIDVYWAKIEERRKRRQEKGLKGDAPLAVPSGIWQAPPEKKGPIKVVFKEQPNGYIKVSFVTRAWARKERQQQAAARGDTDMQVAGTDVQEVGSEQAAE